MNPLARSRFNRLPGKTGICLALMLSMPMVQGQGPEVSRKLDEMRSSYESAYQSQAGDAHDRALKELDKKYLTALERALEKATLGNDLEGALALRDEKQRLENGGPLPSDDTSAPAVLVPLRKTFRIALAALEVERDKRAAPVRARHAAALEAYQTELTRAGDLDGALAVKAIKDQLRPGGAESRSPMTAVLLHYNFSDGSGETVKDRSGNGRDGTLVGFANTEPAAGDAAAPLRDDPFAEKRDNPSGWMKSGALRFDGKDDFVKTPLTVADLGGGSFTLEAVVSYTGSRGSWGPILSVDSRNFDSPGLLFLAKINAGHWNSPASALAWRHNGLSKDYIDSSRATSLFDGRLHHVALVRDAPAREVRVYFDHLLRDRIEGVTGDLPGNHAILIGKTGWNAAEIWTGPISEVRITKRVLAPGQFLPNPNPPLARRPAPKHRWSFSGDLKDSIGGVHGTLVSGDHPPAKARFSKGQLDLSQNQGEPSDFPARDGFVDLPDGIVSKLGGKASFEIWCTQTKPTSHANTFRLERSDTPGEAAVEKNAAYRAIGMSQRSGDYDLLSFVDAGATTRYADADFDLSEGKEYHFVLVLDPADRSSGPGGTQFLYLDGYIVATAALPEGFLDGFKDNNNWLGRGYHRDPMFTGFYNEFRIYDKALTADEVLASHLAGPDAR